jgi:predicted Zn-dependent protease
MKDLVTMIKHKEFAKAKRLLKKTLSRDPDNIYLLTQMANVMWNLEKDKEALSFAMKARNIDPDYPLMLFTLGRVLWSLEDYVASIEVWDKLLHAEFSSVAEKGWGVKWAQSVINDARFYKAMCLYCLTQTKEAKEEMEKHIIYRRKGLESDFSLKEAKEFLLKLTYCTGQENNSKMDTFGWASPKQWATIEKMLAKKKRDISALVAYLKRKRREFPREYYIKTLLAEHLADMGKYAESLQYAKEAYEQEPTDMLVVYDYANALYHNGRYDEAIMIGNIVIQTDTNVIAYGDHGEGLRWAIDLKKDAIKVLNLCMRNQRESKISDDSRDQWGRF